MSYFDDFRNAYKKLLIDLNTKYHLTITYPANMPVFQCEKLLNRLLVHLNRKIFKGRYSRGENYISGVAVLEKTCAMNTIHYHLLIEDHVFIPDFELFDLMINKQINILSGSEGKSKRNYISGYKLQGYYNNGDDRLEQYLTKNFENPSLGIDNAAGNVGLITACNVFFGIDERLVAA